MTGPIRLPFKLARISITWTRPSELEYKTAFSVFPSCSNFHPISPNDADELEQLPFSWWGLNKAINRITLLQNGLLKCYCDENQSFFFRDFYPKLKFTLQRFEKIVSPTNLMKINLSIGLLKVRKLLKHRWSSPQFLSSGVLCVTSYFLLAAHL